MRATVGLARCNDYDPDRIQEALDRALTAAGGIGSFAEDGDRVLLKPNVLLAAPPDKAVCTHPEVLRAAIRAFKEFGCDVVVGEQPGIGTAKESRRALEVSGILEVCREEKVGCRLFRSNGYEAHPVPGGKQVSEIFLPRDFAEVDHVVSVAKLKSHMQAAYTGAIKNFYGAIPTMQRKAIHRLAKYVPFSEGVADILAAVRPSFSILDGIVGMEGKGPSEGKPKQLGLLFASTDPVALDTVAIHAVGWDEYRVHHVDEAAARGLGVGDLAGIEVAGERLDECKTKFAPAPTAFRNPPRFLLNTLYNYWSIKPAILTTECIGCATCAAGCPTDAITLVDGGPTPKAVIDYDKCIECFCCHELCPYGAVAERRSALQRAVARVRGKRKRD